MSDNGWIFLNNLSLLVFCAFCIACCGRACGAL